MLTPILNVKRKVDFRSGDNIEIAKEVFEQMNIEHSAVMRRFSAQGGLLNWDTSTPSVWLTAWALRTFSIIWFQDWEDFIYVDPKVCTKLFSKITIFRKTSAKNS